MTSTWTWVLFWCRRVPTTAVYRREGKGRGREGGWSEEEGGREDGGKEREGGREDGGKEKEEGRGAITCISCRDYGTVGRTYIEIVTSNV